VTGDYGKTELSYSGSCLVCISKHNDTYLDVQALGEQKYIRILLRRGDMFWFRGDVPHRGVEHDANYDHYRIHCYCNMAQTKRAVDKTYSSGSARFAKIGRKRKYMT